MPANPAQLVAAAKKKRAFPDAVQKDRKNLFEQQLRFVESKHRSKIMLCGRRAGKSFTAVHCAIDAAERFPGSTIPVCETATTSQAAKAFWDELHAFEDRHKLDIHFQDTWKVANLSNGSTIELVGTDNIKQCDRVRGNKYPRIIIDEAGTYRSFILQYLIEDAATAALIDLGGDLIVAGTPSVQKAGYWHDICHRPDAWELHHWTLLQNATLGTLERRNAELELIRTRYGWDEQHPKYLREYMGQWAVGTGDRVYHEFLHHRNVIAEIPAPNGHEWRYGLSWDFGFRDPSAFVVTASREHDPRIYCVESWQDTEMTVQAIAFKTQELMARYRFSWIVGDAGGGGKTIVESLARDHRIPIKAAKKTEKALAIEQTNVDLKSGRIQLLEATNRYLIGDLDMLPWNDDCTDAAENFPDHLPDAFLYACREHGVYVEDYGEAFVKPGSEQWYAKLEDQMFEAAIESTRNRDDDYLDGMFDGEAPDLGLPDTIIEGWRE